MATRPRTAGLGAFHRQSIRVYNEPYTPNVEERDENEAHILLLQLPEFTQQHVKVKIEKEERTVVVTGDRIVGSNRLLILDKTYPIPQNCVIERIDHILENGVLTITMPKQTTASEAAETVSPPPKEPEQTTPEKGSEEFSPENATPPPKEPEQSAPEKGIEEISPENAIPPPREPEQTILEEGSGEISPANVVPSPKEPEQTIPETRSEEISQENVVPPETKAGIKGKSAELQKQASTKAEVKAPTPAPAEAEKGPEEGDKGKSAGLQKQASAKAKEEAPTPARKSAGLQKQASAKAEEEAPTPTSAVVPPPTEAEKGPVQGDSDEAKTTPDQKPTEKKEIEKQNSEKEKESETEQVNKNEETAKIGTGTPSPRATGFTKRAGVLRVRKMLVPVTASLAAAVGMGVAAYFAYAYYGLSFATV